MITHYRRLTIALVLSLATTLSAATRYVDANSAAPTPPYTNWATAAQVIQDAVDAAESGDEIVVTNGVYATGGRAVYGMLTNRVAVTKPLTLRSINGSEFTVIRGHQIPGSTNGDAAIRCLYLANGAVFSGFTLTGGATRNSGDAWDECSGGGVWCVSTNAVVTNCTLTGNSASRGGGACGGTLNRCTLSGNSAGLSGGGAVFSTLNHCKLTGNSANWNGGGANEATLNNCTLHDNSAGDSGGGADYAELHNCTLTGNSAYAGGGAYDCELRTCTLTGNSAYVGGGAKGGNLHNCTLTRNSAADSGGGAYDGTLNNCMLTGNSAGDFGGGVHSSTLNNCTLTDNSAGEYGGGACRGTLNNCIVYYNHAFWENNYSGSYLSYCSTTPLPLGVGNLTAEPQLASPAHLSAGSPCRSTGSAAYTTGMDIDGDAWALPPSIGCDEYRTGAMTGPLTVSIRVAFTNVAVGFPVALTACIEGRASANAWNFGDDVVVSNRPYASHAWASPGEYEVVFTVYNESAPMGVSATQTVQVVMQPVHHVALVSNNPQTPYGSWATAARTIQEAVDAAVVPGALVLVTNGVYTTGGRAVHETMTNRVAVDKPVILRSVNGPESTVILGFQLPDKTNGDGAIRCVYLTNGACLSGFTLKNGATRNDWNEIGWNNFRQHTGGGAWCESGEAVITNCTLADNSAKSGGGGAYSGTLINCTLTGNSAVEGGGTSYSTLNHCTLKKNSATAGGGGATQCLLTYCTLTGNSAYTGGGASWSTLSHCTLTGNSAKDGGGGTSSGNLDSCVLRDNSALHGGGANSCNLINCTLSGNSASSDGGGAYGCGLNNCTLTRNSANTSGGGATYGVLANSIAYYNSAPSGSNYSEAMLIYCCAAPLYGTAFGSIYNEPMFVDIESGNLRLQPNSPCINTGQNANATTSTDLDDTPRIVGGTVDMGAYEFQSPASTLSYAWLQQFNLPTDGSADFADADLDGHNNWQEWRADTVPTNALSRLAVHAPTNTPTGLTVTWQSVVSRRYSLERSTNLANVPAMLTLATNIPGQSGTTTFTDTTATNSGPYFYRIGVWEYE